MPDNMQVVYFSDVRGKLGFEALDASMARAARGSNRDFEFWRKTHHLYGLEDKELVNALQMMGYDAALFFQDSKSIGYFAFQQKETAGDIGLCFVYVEEALRNQGFRDICARAFVESQKTRGTRRIFTSRGRPDKPLKRRLNDESVARMVARLGEKASDLGIRVSPEKGLIELI